MKRLLTTTIIVMILSGTIFAGDAPIDPGSVILGGTIYVQRTTGELYHDATTFTVHPSCMYFVKRGIAVGANLMYDHIYHHSTHHSYLSIGPQVAFLIDNDRTRIKYAGKAMPFLRLFLNVYRESYLDRSWYFGGQGKITTGFSIGGSGGAAIFLSNAVSLDAGLMAVRSYRDTSSSRSRTGWTLQLGMGLTGYVYWTPQTNLN